MDDRTTQNRNYKISNWTRSLERSAQLCGIRAIDSSGGIRCSLGRSGSKARRKKWENGRSDISKPKLQNLKLDPLAEEFRESFVESGRPSGKPPTRNVAGTGADD